MSYGSHGVVTAVDVSVVNPLHPPFSQAMPQPGIAAETRQLQKVALYKSACAVANWFFVPVVVETTGAWGVVGQKLVGKLVRLLSQHRGINIQASSREVWDRLATVVARHVASNFLGHSLLHTPLRKWRGLRLREKTRAQVLLSRSR